METRSFLGSPKPIEILKSGHCRVCGQKAVEPTVIIQIERRWLIVALVLALYVLIDIADSGHLDGSIAHWALSFLLGGR
jgi:hypothetical protein